MTARQRIGPKFDGWVGPWHLSRKFGWWRDYRCFEHLGEVHRWAVRFSAGVASEPLRAARAGHVES